ncbi:hypothetical protein [Glycomyces sp. NRRL B-16210]|uniref:hypothetical protein n=1 Tax=Glycomyces sp. NRRL B-16210 TaxID=1463821 RepID=UPI0004C289E1|nr:hypothetical protein [Glycomyces sp. NRRL B-16210]
MWRYSIIAAALLALSACGQQADESADAEDPPSMPEVIFTVSERGEDDAIVMEAIVNIAPDGTWERTGTEPGSGALTDEEVARIGELVEEPDFPEDPENERVCTTAIPAYSWSLVAGDEWLTNGNGGCVFSDSGAEIVAIIQEAADVGPTLE